MKSSIVILLLLVWSIWGLCGCKRQEEMVFFTSEAAETENTELQNVSGEETALSAQIKVYVCGAVAEPGVVALKEGSRIIDAVVLAGGMTAEADETYVNLAAKLTDGEKVYVPTKEEAGMWQESQAEDDLVNINTADTEELCRLPGIGESKAEDIILYREKNGKFQKIEDIVNVPGIKKSLFEKISGKIKVE